MTIPEHDLRAIKGQGEKYFPVHPQNIVGNINCDIPPNPTETALKNYQEKVFDPEKISPIFQEIILKAEAKHHLKTALDMLAIARKETGSSTPLALEPNISPNGNPSGVLLSKQPKNPNSYPNTVEDVRPIIFDEAYDRYLKFRERYIKQPWQVALYLSKITAFATLVDIPRGLGLNKFSDKAESFLNKFYGVAENPELAALILLCACEVTAGNTTPSTPVPELVTPTPTTESTQEIELTPVSSKWDVVVSHADINNLPFNSNEVGLNNTTPHMAFEINYDSSDTQITEFFIQSTRGSHYLVRKDSEGNWISESLITSRGGSMGSDHVSFRISGEGILLQAQLSGQNEGKLSIITPDGGVALVEIPGIVFEILSEQQIPNNQASIVFINRSLQPESIVEPTPVPDIVFEETLTPDYKDAVLNLLPENIYQDVMTQGQIPQVDILLNGYSITAGNTTIEVILNSQGIWEFKQMQLIDGQWQEVNLQPVFPEEEAVNGHLAFEGSIYTQNEQGNWVEATNLNSALERGGYSNVSTLHQNQEGNLAFNAVRENEQGENISVELKLIEKTGIGLTLVEDLGFIYNVDPNSITPPTNYLSYRLDEVNGIFLNNTRLVDVSFNRLTPLKGPKDNIIPSVIEVEYHFTARHSQTGDKIFFILTNTARQVNKNWGSNDIAGIRQKYLEGDGEFKSGDYINNAIILALRFSESNSPNPQAQGPVTKKILEELLEMTFLSTEVGGKDQKDALIDLMMAGYGGESGSISPETVIQHLLDYGRLSTDKAFFGGFPRLLN